MNVSWAFKYFVYGGTLEKVIQRAMFFARADEDMKWVDKNIGEYNMINYTGATTLTDDQVDIMIKLPPLLHKYVSFDMQHNIVARILSIAIIDAVYLRAHWVKDRASVIRTHVASAFLFAYQLQTLNKIPNPVGADTNCKDCLAQFESCKTAEECKRMFRILSKLLHPDKDKENPNAAVEFNAMKKCYDNCIKPKFQIPMFAYAGLGRVHW